MILPILLLSAGLIRPQSTEDRSSPLVFRYTATTTQLPSYSFRVLPDGSGTYLESVKEPDGAVHDLASELNLSRKATQSLFEKAKILHRNGFACASKAKNVANTGSKTLDFDGGSCTYNFSEDKTVVALTAAFQAMAFTLDEGRKLNIKLRYDRLGLNDEMTILWDAVKDGRAAEVENIEGILATLANDEQVFERVRQRAADLLKMRD
jgi:hypothetical protein